MMPTGKRTIDVSADLDSPPGTWQLVEYDEGRWHLYRNGVRVGIVTKRYTPRGARGWYATLDDGGILSARGNLAVTGSTFWRTRKDAIAAMARAQAGPRRTR